MEKNNPTKLTDTTTTDAAAVEETATAAHRRQLAARAEYIRQRILTEEFLMYRDD